MKRIKITRIKDNEFYYEFGKRKGRGEYLHSPLGKLQIKRNDGISMSGDQTIELFDKLEDKLGE